MKDVWKFITMECGRPCVMTPGAWKKLMSCVGSWDTGVQYQLSQRHFMVKDLVITGRSSGTALEVNPVWWAVVLLFQVATTVKMPQSSALALVSEA